MKLSIRLWLPSTVAHVVSSPSSFIFTVTAPVRLYPVQKHQEDIPFPLTASCSQAGRAKKKKKKSSSWTHKLLLMHLLRDRGWKQIAVCGCKHLICAGLWNLFIYCWLSACSLHLIQIPQCFEINLCFKISFWVKRPVGNWLIGILRAASASHCFPDRLLSYLLLEGTLQRAVL